jgi:hypothetical protein
MDKTLGKQASIKPGWLSMQAFELKRIRSTLPASYCLQADPAVVRFRECGNLH